ncbi:UNVERIFIED_CONTAM: hypothetical protein FKN15_031271 [Acipenser sinensis]
MGSSSSTTSCNRNITFAGAYSTFASPSTPIAEATVTNASKDNLRAYYSTTEIQLSEIASTNNAFKPDSPVPFLALPADDVINFTPGEGFFTTVLVEDASTPGISAGTIVENFRVPPGRSVVITASRKIVLRKIEEDNERIDDEDQLE